MIESLIGPVFAFLIVIGLMQSPPDLYRHLWGYALYMIAVILVGTSCGWAAYLMLSKYLA